MAATRSPFVRLSKFGDFGPSVELGFGGQGGPVGSFDIIEHITPGPAAEDDEVDQRVGAEPVGAVDGDAGRFAGGVEAVDHLGGWVADDLAVDVRRQAAHRVVGGGLNRHWLGLRLDSEVSPGEIGHVWEFGVDYLRRQVREVEVDVVLAVDAAALLDLFVDEAGDHVARGQVLQRRRVALGKGFAGAVAEDAAFAAGGFGEEDAQLVQPRRMELVELHVHQRDALAVGEGHAVSRAGQGVRGDLEDPAEAAGGDQDGLGVEGIDLSRLDVHGDHAAATAVVGEEDVEQVMLVEEVDLVLDSLLVEGLDDHMAGAVGGVAGAAHRGLAEVASVATKAALVDPAVRCPVKGETHVFEFEHGVDRLAGEDLGGVLVDQVVSPLDRVEHVPLPVVFFGVAQGGADAPLGGARVGAGRIELGDDRDVRLAGQLDGGHESGAACSDDDGVEAMVGHGCESSLDRTTGRDTEGAAGRFAPRERHKEAS